MIWRQFFDSRKDFGAPIVVSNEPQSRQAEELMAVVKRPFGQSRHSVSPAKLYCPRSHGPEQLLEFMLDALPKNPGGQALHESNESAPIWSLQRPIAH